MAVTILASVAAFYSSARGLQDGEAVPVIAVTGTAANISCIAGGIIVFGDPMPGDALGIVLQAIAFVMVIVASALTPAPVRAANGAPGRRYGVASGSAAPLRAHAVQQHPREDLGVVGERRVARGPCSGTNFGRTAPSAARARPRAGAAGSRGCPRRW